VLLARSMTIPGVVTVADGESDVLGVMETPHLDARKLGACPLQAVNLRNAWLVANGRADVGGQEFSG
jgi:hypothetical protein